MLSIFTFRTKDRSGSRKRSKPASRNHYRPRLEWLEGRVVPSITVNLDQFANHPPSWQNGDLNGSNSAYHEGSVVPFRLALEGLTPGATDTIHLNYDFTAGGHEAYDFLATYNATETGVNAFASRGGNTTLDPAILALQNTTPTTAAFPSDPFVPNPANGLTVSGAQTFSGVGQNLTIYGATNVSITPAAGPTHSGSTSGNSTGDLVVHFTPTSGGNGAVFLVWGGHLAQSAYWNKAATTGPNGPNGAGQISGAPWHMRTQNLTENGTATGAKNQDRSIQPSALVMANTSTATVIKDATTNGTPTGALGESVYDTATVTGTPGTTPTGTVTYEFFKTLDGTGTHTDQVVTLNADGTVPNSTATAALAAGSYSYKAVYSGDSNYNGSTSVVEPLTINKADTSTATVIKDANNTAITNPVAFGTTVHDTATVTGTPGFTPTGTVTYEFFNTIDGTGSHTDETVTLTNGTVPDSAAHGPLAGGSYSFKAVYSGDSNYNGSTSAVEPLQVLLKSQIAPTGTTAAQFVNGTSSTLAAISYSNDGTGHIAQNVNPGVFFYFSFVTVTAPNTTINVDEVLPSNSPTPFLIAGTSTGNLALYNATGTTVVASGTDLHNGNVSFTAPSAGTFVVVVKYDAKSIAGGPVPSPNPTATYTFDTRVGSTVQAQSTVDLKLS